jgi:hypothetical protein
MADGYFPTLISKDKDPNAVADPIYVQLSDGAAAVGMVSDAIKVNVTNSTGGSAVNIQDGGNSITVDGSVAVSAVGGTVAVTESGTWNVGVNNASGASAVNIQDGGNSITVDGSVTVSGTVTVTATALDIRALTLATDAVKISANSTANSISNPIFVALGSGPITGEVHAYDATSVGANTTGNQDYTVVTAMLVKGLECSASGGAKFELQTGPVASLVSKWTGFVPKAGGTVSVKFDPPIEVPVTSTGTVRVIRSNRESQAQSIYTTIMGIDA